MTKAIDDTISKFIEKLQYEEAHGSTAGPGRAQEDPVTEAPAPEQEQGVQPRQPHTRRLTWYSRVATALIVLLLVATGISYFLYKNEREAITSRIDAIVRTPMQNPVEQRLLVLERQFANTGSENESRWQAMEQRLMDSHQAYEQRLQDMDQRLVQLHEPQERRLQQVEQRLARLQPPDVKRLQSIENRLAEITARMDNWATVVAGLSSEDQSGATLPAATLAEPPAAIPIEPVVVARNDAVLPSPQSLPEVSRQTPPPAKPLPEAFTVKPPPAAASAAPDKPGDWVINIGSYLGKRIASRKLSAFRKLGVDAELVTATVRGRTIFRIQVPGFESMAAANSEARGVRETLGLEETWIRRR